MIDQFFRYKSNIFIGPLEDLTAQKLLENLEKYRQFKRQERIEKIQELKAAINQLYIDESKPLLTCNRYQGRETGGVYCQIG